MITWTCEDELARIFTPTYPDGTPKHVKFIEMDRMTHYAAVYLNNGVVIYEPVESISSDIDTLYRHYENYVAENTKLFYGENYGTKKLRTVRGTAGTQRV